MGASFNADLNVVDPLNSTSTPLGAFGTFTGQFRDVSDYSSVSVSCISDVASSFSGLAIDWSTDGITANIAPQLFTFDPVNISQDGLTVHATVRAKFYRIRYENAFQAQTSFVLESLLRKGTPAGTVRSVDPVNTFITNLDVQETQAILSGVGRFNQEQVMLPLLDDIDFVFGRQVYLFVSPRPAFSDGVDRKVTTASLTPVKLSNFGRERAIFISITNNVRRGNLYVQLDTSTGLSPTTWDFVVPPGHTWQDPGQFGTGYAGNLWGVWDEVEFSPGNAKYICYRYT